MPRDIKIKSKKILIVEGEDECDIFNFWFEKLKIENVQILGIGGKTQLSQNLVLLKKDSDFDSVEEIRIIRDADENANAAFQSVCSSLRNATLPVPLSQNQSSATTLKPIIKVFIASNTNNKGSIESYFFNALTDEKRFPCVEEYFNCIKKYEGTVFLESKLEIAKVYVYLAGVPEYSRYRLGWTVSKGLWDLTKSAFKDLLTFISVW